jgi:hypothetical protein
MDQKIFEMIHLNITLRWESGLLIRFLSISQLLCPDPDIVEPKYCVFRLGSETCCGTTGSVADPGSGALLTFDPGSRISDPGSQTHIFESLGIVFFE